MYIKFPGADVVVLYTEGIGKTVLHKWLAESRREETGMTSKNIHLCKWPAEECWREPLVLHADNGAAMTSQTLKAKPESLNITGSHSRPRLSNDNPYVESLSRTLKYVTEWPSAGFTELAGARKWVGRLMQ